MGVFKLTIEQRRGCTLTLFAGGCGPFRNCGVPAWDQHILDNQCRFRCPVDFG